MFESFDSVDPISCCWAVWRNFVCKNYFKDYRRR